MEILGQGRVGYWTLWKGEVNTGAIGVAAEVEAVAEAAGAGLKAKAVVRVGGGV